MVAFHQFEHSLTKANVRGTKLCIRFAICCDGIKSPAKAVMSARSISVVSLEDDAQRPPHVDRPAGGACPCAPLATSCGPVSEALQRAAHVSGVAALTVILYDRKCSWPIMDPLMPVFCCSWTGENDAGALELGLGLGLGSEWLMECYHGARLIPHIYHLILGVFQLIWGKKPL